MLFDNSEDEFLPSRLTKKMTTEATIQQKLKMNFHLLKRKCQKKITTQVTRTNFKNVVQITNASFEKTKKS